MIVGSGARRIDNCLRSRKCEIGGFRRRAVNTSYFRGPKAAAPPT
jgi:hypothetical protein